MTSSPFPPPSGPWSDFTLTNPAALIAALPAVLGFAPEHSLVLVTLARGELGSVMRVGLSDDLLAGVDQLAEVASRARCDAAIAVIVDAAGADCTVCGDDHAELAAAVSRALSQRGIALWAAHVVDQIAPGGRWHCADGCGAGGVIDDPAASPLAAAAVFEGRRLYGRRADLEALIAGTDPARTAGLLPAISAEAMSRAAAGDDPARTRRDVRTAMTVAARLADGRRLTDRQAVRLACALTDVAVRDTLYALAVGVAAAAAEALWAELTRLLPDRWRVEPLVLLAFSAYVRGDGPLAGIALEAALRIDGAHRMAVMLDKALQSGMRPEQIRELGATGYALAERLGIRLPGRTFAGRRRAG
ncbi:DUF4192 domain-containing protein [Mycobacterium sp. MYCO198283]|uniref:DUF4192 domain-containing protein n=1 Tax=Mycobacterium sp. MYCO198283 TaxID=2883505 RepID=UPI001E47879B|nr:DUF4192 domain-containing protein [Mycobacterium sp. MYCO198283]MCG5433874.1 DUF4192 domain-containing protein [Mycobacterium sp. MYCO198283]